MSKIAVLTDQDVESVLPLRDVIRIVEEGFKADGRRANDNFDVVRVRLNHPSEGIFGIKSGFMREAGFLGLKAGGYWANNKVRGVPTHQSTMVLFDPETGRPAAFVRANYITKVRTGAAGAVAAKYLARQDARRVGIIGCGTQGRIQLEALAERFPLECAIVFNRSREGAEAFQREMADRLPFPIEIAANVQAVVESADIVVTATPGGGAVVRADQVRGGQHIGAIGSDTVGKQELDPRILTRAKLVADNLSQCKRLGEMQHLAGIGIDPDSCCHAELGEIVAGQKPGRTDPDELTVYDATGVTFQDLIVAGAAYERCVEQGVGERVSF